MMLRAELQPNGYWALMVGRLIVAVGPFERTELKSQLFFATRHEVVKRLQAINCDLGEDNIVIGL